MSDDNWLNVTVKGLERKPGDTLALTLAAIDGAALPAFEAGAHIDVRVTHEIVRQYSLCGDPQRSDIYRLGILKELKSRGGSSSLNENCQIGDILSISRPKNLFPLAEGRHSILIGGGIGITPLMAMAYELSNQVQSFELHYCVANEDRAAFLSELRAASFATHVNVYFSRSDVLPSFSLPDHIPSYRGGHELYVCGPDGFMTSVFEKAQLHGYPLNNLHKESFGAEVDLSGSSFSVVAQQTGVTVSVGEGDRIVDALAAAGIEIEVSCEEGVCGTCLCDVIEGTPDHRDSFLTNEERDANDMILVCCSRSKSPTLVLDI